MGSTGSPSARRGYRLHKALGRDLVQWAQDKAGQGPVMGPRAQHSSSGAGCKEHTQGQMGSAGTAGRGASIAFGESMFKVTSIMFSRAGAGPGLLLLKGINPLNVPLDILSSSLVIRAQHRELVIGMA